jgi:hypothetical protein
LPEIARVNSAATVINMSASRNVYRELIIHSAAFLVAAAFGAILICPYYGIFEHDTDSPSAAREAFLAASVIAGGLGPATTLSLFWLVHVIRRLRT